MYEKYFKTVFLSIEEFLVALEAEFIDTSAYCKESYLFVLKPMKCKVVFSCLLHVFLFYRLVYVLVADL